MADRPEQQDRDFAPRARAISLLLTGWRSVTGTAEEAAFPQKLISLLRELPYFRAHPDHLRTVPVPHDALGRAGVLALVRGEGAATVVLAGHFDTVPVDNYDDLAELAGDPAALRQGLIARLRAGGIAYRQALADLEGPDYLPGRGLLDMKSGLAAGLAVLERFAADAQRAGTLLLIATPDEEDRSAGMRAVAAMLPGFLNQQGLAVRLGINLDALCDNGDGSEGRTVALGCIGKLLLTAFVVGKDGHACYPLDGVNGAYLAAELVTEFECAAELAEETGAELAAPPTALGSRDLRATYNVTTPSRIWTYWNVLTQRRTAGEVMAIARRLAERAVARAAARMQQRAATLRNRPAVTPAWSRIAVLDFAELRAGAAGRDAAFEARFAALAEELAGRAELDLPARARLLTELAWDAAAIEAPAVVLGFGSMPYPAVIWPGDGALEARIRTAVAATERRFGTAIRVIHHLPVISDMSFLGPVDAADLRATAAQTPLWGSSIDWDLAAGALPGFPMLNIGPWGRDYHHWLERVNAPYAFTVLPALVWNVARGVLD